MSKKLMEKIYKKSGIDVKSLKKERDKYLDWSELEEVANIVIENVIIKEDVKVGILYDVDVDGLFSGYILEDYFERNQIEVKRYMNKNKQHGLNKENLKKFILDKLDWVFVVDAGSGDGKYINFLNKKGINVVVLDHHPYEQTVKLNDEKSWILNVTDKPELPRLSGCGVVYRFIEKMAESLGDIVGQYEKFVGITVLSDMCDMSVPENRYYVKRAYEEYRGNRFLQQFRFYGSGRSFYSFGVIPYLNACIRVGEERHAMEMINNMNNAAKMNKLERDRNRVITKQRKMVDEILEKSKLYKLEDVVLLLRRDNEDTLRTVGGLVANQLLGKYQKPVLVLNRTGDVWKGSLRSNTFKKSDLKECGFDAQGHDYACGIEVLNEDLVSFMKNFKYTGEKLKTKVTFTVPLGKLPDKVWEDLAMFNEFAGTNMPSIKVRLKETIEDARHIDEVSNKKNDIVFKEAVITDFTRKEESEIIVEPILSKNSYQLIRV